MKSAILASLIAFSSVSAQQTWIEAESFANPGGWVLETQFIDVMGSPYLMAHGMGKVVKDASTDVKVPAGEYTLWARTKNWVGPWDAPGAPGRFEISVNGEKLKHEFGVSGKDWQWEKAGPVKVSGEGAKIVLHDLTGFDGRVDAIILSSDAGFTPPQDVAATNKLRRQLLGLPEKAKCRWLRY